MIQAYESGYCERETGLLLLSALQTLMVAGREGCCCKKRRFKKVSEESRYPSHPESLSSKRQRTVTTLERLIPICSFRGLWWQLPLSNQFIMNSRSEEQYACKTLGQNCHYHKSTSGRRVCKDRHKTSLKHYTDHTEYHYSH